MQVKREYDVRYGLATFDMSQYGYPTAAYGHLGATYGYQSLIIYYPDLKAGISVASNLETDLQAQPSDVLCFAYSAIKSLLDGTPAEQCIFEQTSYTSSSCKCYPAGAPTPAPAGGWDCNYGTKTCAFNQFSHGTENQTQCMSKCNGTHPGSGYHCSKILHKCEPSVFTKDNQTECEAKCK
jgi:hypothetical protein